MRRIQHTRFSVTGHPQPKGSTRAFVPKGWTRPVITGANPKSKPWEEAIHDAACSEISVASPVTGHSAFRVRLRFVMPRPKRLRADIRISQLHLVRPDLDKLCRCVCDALTGVAWRDDSQVTALWATKRYTRGGEEARVDITLTEINGEDRI